VHVAGFALAEHLAKPFHALSTGTRRKVCMAAALASGAPLTLIDDPIAGLDKPSVTYLAQALNSCADQPERAVVVAHHAPLPGVRWAHRVDLAGLGR
jgi:ABC-type Mn2+/Zn2+ transport system ATPase subunit